MTYNYLYVINLNIGSEHLEKLKLEHPQKSKREKWLRDKHNRTFGNWLQQRVIVNLALMFTL
jgi:hypothetical protein